MFGTAAFGEAMFAEQSYRDMSLPFSTHTPWILQVRTSEGEMLHRLDGWYDCREQRKLNQPGTLSFSIPLEHPVVETGDLAGPNEIWTVDGSGIVQHKYYIQEEHTRLNVRSNTYSITASGYLKFLSEQRPHITLSAVETIGDLVTAIVGSYDGTPAITEGFVAPAIAAAALDLEDGRHQSLLSLMNTVRKSGIGGWFELDNERALNWYDLKTTFSEQVLQLPSNLEGYEEKTQRGEIFNRVWATGGVIGPGNDKTILRLDAPGYLEDATSIATYGRRSKLLSRQTIRKLSQLTSFAQNFLDDHKNPPVKRTLPVIDLSMLQQDPDNLTTRIESIVRLGTPVTLKPPVEIPGSPVPFNVNVFGFTRKLDNPLEVTIEFNEEEVDIFRMLVSSDGDQNIYITNTFNQYDQVFEDLWQALNDGLIDLQNVIDALVFPEFYVDLGDTPNAFGAGGEIHQVNTAGNALTALVMGANEGMRLTPNSGVTALEWVNFIQYTGASKGALGTPPIPALGLITSSGDNRLMLWDADAVVSANSDNWRDVTSFGKKAS